MHRGYKPYTPTASGKLWTTLGVRCLIIIYDHGMSLGLVSNIGPIDLWMNALLLWGGRGAVRVCGQWGGGHGLRGSL